LVVGDIPREKNFPIYTAQKRWFGTSALARDSGKGLAFLWETNFLLGIIKGK
jgi:hypothetical protein